MIDTLRLRSHIRRSGYKLNYVARVVGVSPNTLRLKLQNRTDFKIDEARRLAGLLALSAQEREACFWAAKADKKTENTRRG